MKTKDLNEKKKKGKGGEVKGCEDIRGTKNLPTKDPYYSLTKILAFCLVFIFLCESSRP